MAIQDDNEGKAAPNLPPDTGSDLNSEPTSPRDDLSELDSFLGETIHGYHFLRIIGFGGAAVVFQVEKDGQVFAAKASLDLDIGSDYVRSSFMNEYNLLKSLDHPNIIRAFDFIEHEGRQIIILEYFESCTLQQFIMETSMKKRQKRLKKITKPVAKALKYLHENGIVHRDIKPANILIGRKDKVKVIDFGGALKLDPSQMVEDRRPTFFTPDFAPPEVHARDVRSACDLWMYAYDMWSFGVTLYQGLTGTCPYPVEDDLCIKREEFFKGPDFYIMKKLDTRLMSLIKKCLDIQPSTRISAKEALKSKYFWKLF